LNDSYGMTRPSVANTRSYPASFPSILCTSSYLILPAQPIRRCSPRATADACFRGNLKLDLNVHPGERSSFISASTVCWVGSRMSSSACGSAFRTAPRLLVHVGRAQHGILIDAASAAGSGPPPCPGLGGRIDDVGRGLVQQLVVVALSRIRILVFMTMRVSFLLFDDLGDHPAPPCGPLPNRKPQLLLHRDRGDQLRVIATLSPGITISTPSGRCNTPSRPSCENKTAADNP